MFVDPLIPVIVPQFHCWLSTNTSWCGARIVVGRTFEYPYWFIDDWFVKSGEFDGIKDGECGDPMRVDCNIVPPADEGGCWDCELWIWDADDECNGEPDGFAEWFDNEWGI